MNLFLRSARWLAKPIVGLFGFLGWFLGNGKNRRRFAIASGLVLIGTGVAAELLLAPRHLPWHPLAIDDRAGFSTDLKLAAIELGPSSWCNRLLARSAKLRVSSVKPMDGEGDCGWSEAFDINASGGVTLNGNPPFAMRCALTAGAHIWLTSVNHRAREILGSELTQVRHYGTYSCRRMYGRRRGPISEHAYANAWDVAAFELADGSVVSVLQGWKTRGPQREFLHAIRDDACNIFDVVLGPDFNAEHRDHLHLDMGPGSRCR